MEGRNDSFFHNLEWIERGDQVHWPLTLSTFHGSVTQTPVMLISNVNLGRNGPDATSHAAPRVWIRSRCSQKQSLLSLALAAARGLQSPAVKRGGKARALPCSSNRRFPKGLDCESGIRSLLDPSSLVTFDNWWIDNISDFFFFEILIFF